MKAEPKAERPLKPRRRAHKLICGSCSLDLSVKTAIMGILNRTPDSFYDGGRFMDDNAALQHAKNLALDGADIIDIGGESTRPGSKPISLSEELSRTIPLIKRISEEINIPISIDTSKHEVAAEAIRAGASMVNDITGLRSDPKMKEVVRKTGAALCVMHMKGTPEDMQDNPVYHNLMPEIIASLKESVEIAEGAGIPADRIVVDPGIGFGKTTAHNLEIINRLFELEILDKPILIGVSRKSFIGKITGKEPAGRLMGTAAAFALAIARGANIIRVHDVEEMADVAKIVDAIIGKTDA